MTDEEAVVQAKKIITSVSGMLDQEVAVVQPKRSTSGTVDREEAVVQPKHSVTSISGTVDREVAVYQPKHSLTSTSGKVDREVAVVQPNNSLTSTSGTMDREVAVVQPKHSLASVSSDVVPSPVASIPVSMVVHGGTGVLHGNMTSLTVNQYIGMVPERGRGAWDSSMVRELVADAVKISADANAQLFHPSDSVSKPVHSGNLLCLILTNYFFIEYGEIESSHFLDSTL